MLQALQQCLFLLFLSIFTYMRSPRESDSHIIVHTNECPPPSLVVRVYYAIPHEYTHILYSVRNVLYERKHIAQKRRLTNEKRSRVELYALQRNWFSRYLSILFSSFLCFILPINGPPVSAKPFDTMPSRSFAYFFLFLFFL